MVDEAQIQLIVKETIKNLIRAGYINRGAAETSAAGARILKEYYRAGETNGYIAAAIQKIRGDYYAKIIPLFYKRQKKLEQIAEYYSVDVSTIKRNKRRLCGEFYVALQDITNDESREKNQNEIAYTDSSPHE